MWTVVQFNQFWSIRHYLELSCCFIDNLLACSFVYGSDETSLSWLQIKRIIIVVVTVSVSIFLLVAQILNTTTSNEHPLVSHCGYMYELCITAMSIKFYMHSNMSGLTSKPSNQFTPLLSSNLFSHHPSFFPHTLTHTDGHNVNGLHPHY